MQSEIPEDVMNAARASTVAYFNSFGAYAEADAVSNKDRDHWGEVQSAAWAIMAERERCKADLSAAEPSVAVKALEWEEGPAGSYMEVCESILGTYRVWEINGMSCVSLGGGPGRTCGSTLYDAKAAAQSDYEARILSALTAQVQDVATAREFADRMFKLSGFMLSEEYRGKPAVTFTFPNNAERNQFYSAIVELSAHKTTSTQEGIV